MNINHNGNAFSYYDLDFGKKSLLNRYQAKCSIIINVKPEMQYFEFVPVCCCSAAMVSISWLALMMAPSLSGKRRPRILCVF